MTDITKLMQKKVEQESQRFATALADADRGARIEFIRSEFEDLMIPDRNQWYRKVMFDYVHQGEFDECLKLIEKDRAGGWFYQAFKDVVSQLLDQGHAIPQSLVVYFADIELGRRQRPKSTKGSPFSHRDHFICRCVATLEQHCNLQPTRSEGSNTECGCELVADAIRSTYTAVAKVWKHRDKGLWNK